MGGDVAGEAAGRMGPTAADSAAGGMSGSSGAGDKPSGGGEADATPGGSPMAAALTGCIASPVVNARIRLLARAGPRPTASRSNRPANLNGLNRTPLLWGHGAPTASDVSRYWLEHRGQQLARRLLEVHALSLVAEGGIGDAWPP